MIRALVLALGLVVPASGRAAAPSWDFVVRVVDLPRGLLEIDWTVHGLPSLGRVCADMGGAGRAVSALRQVSAAGERALVADKDDADCFLVPRPADPLRLRYRSDLGRLTRLWSDPDYAMPVGDDWVWNDESVLLRPDPLPDDGALSVAFELPPGASVAAPWRRLPGPALRFAYDAKQYDAGAYVAMGRVVSLGEHKVGDGVVSLALVDHPRRTSDAALVAWVTSALGRIADFYRTLPGKRVHVVLVPVGGEKEGGLFGSVLRRAAPSVLLTFGGEASASDFAADWVATHELFHLGNPPVERKVPWFIEGFTTYYQDVLRGRGMLAPAAMWSDLYDGFRRFCDRPGHSLDEDSRSLRETHLYQRVYWGGACLAFRADVAIREHSDNRRSLDDVMRELGASPRKLSEGEIIAALDRAAGRPVAREHLRATGRIALESTWRALGIQPIGPDRVKLIEDAPKSALRRSIF